MAQSAHYRLALRLERAREHLESFIREVADFLGTSEFPLVGETEQLTGDRIYLAGEMPAPPPTLGLIVGDCVHNLRSTLDHLVCDLSLVVDASTPCEKTSFPVCTSMDAWKTCLGKELARVPSAAAKRIFNIQPLHWRTRAPEGYKLHPMWELNELWNWDKHRSFHLVHWASSKHTFLEIEGNDGVGVSQYLDPGPIIEGMLIARVPAAKAKLVRVSLKPRVHFDLGGPARGKDVGIALRGYYNLVENAIKELSPYLEPGPSAA
jgi:hypothetical protein